MELFSPGHLIPLLIIALVLFFGWKQLPDMARSLGRSLRIFKTEIKGMGEDDAARDAARRTRPPPAIARPPPPFPACDPALIQPRPADRRRSHPTCNGEPGPGAVRQRAAVGKPSIDQAPCARLTPGEPDRSPGVRPE